MSKVSYLTEEGLQKLINEIEHLISIERPAISRLLAEARDKGDLSENAEYVAAKEEQRLLELKILKFGKYLVNTRIIDESKIDTSKVQILNKIKIKNTSNDKIKEYVIVSESEADLKAGKISVNTPIAKGLLGKRVGDVVEVNVPSGIISFEVVEISR